MTNSESFNKVMTNLRIMACNDLSDTHYLNWVKKIYPNMAYNKLLVECEKDGFYKEQKALYNVLQKITKY
jgi:hypothetical protein